MGSRLTFDTHFSELISLNFSAAVQSIAEVFHAGISRTLPFFQTTGDNPRFRFSKRTFRATRPNARIARATNTGASFAPFAFRFLFILQSRTYLNKGRRGKGVSQQFFDSEKRKRPHRVAGKGVSQQFLTAGDKNRLTTMWTAITKQPVG